MPWTFKIEEGKILEPLGSILSNGYAGHGVGVNNIFDEAIKDVGPIPEGFYHMGKWYDDPEKGKIVCHLIPFPETQTYGRGGFMIHGDSILHPGQASLGCLIAPYNTRFEMSQSEDQVLQVCRN
jgi:hypothetical protein